MEKRQLGQTDMQVSVLGFGGAEIGFEGAAEETVECLLNSALDAGLNVIDTGECYEGSEELIGKTVWEANPVVTGILTHHHALLAQEKLDHSYPHCWRCHKPTIFRATEQWFIGMERNNFRQAALQAVREVKWMPAWGEAPGSANSAHSEEDSWKLVHFIRHLPNLTFEEKKEMEKMNPKGPEDRKEEQEEENFLEGEDNNHETIPHHHH